MTVMILTFLSLKRSFLSFYLCSGNMILAISVKLSTFEPPGASLKKIEFS